MLPKINVWILFLFGALLSLGVFLFFGCSESSRQSVVVATHRKEIAAYIEAFNTDQDQYRMELQFIPEGPITIPSEGPVPDLVISEHIAGRDTIKNFRSLDSLFYKRKISLRSFYTGLLRLGKKDNKQHLLPASFDLPLLMYNNRLPGKENEKFLLNLEDIKTISASYNKVQSGRFINMGFSPLWYPDFLLVVALLHGAEFTEDGERVLSFKEKNIQNALSFLRDWSKTNNGGASAEIEYQEKYLTTPPYRQASLERVRYAYSTASSFFLLPENRRLGLDLRWIGNNDKITTLENVLFMGIPVKAENSRGAEAFLSWFFQPSTQKKLLEASQRKFTHFFGIFSGFSSLKEINETEYPRLYPILVGHIPPEEILVFPPPVPFMWGELKKRIILPYFLDQVQDAKQEEKLQDRLNAWLMARPIH